MAPSSGSNTICVGITNSRASQRAVAYAATQLAQPGDIVHLICVLLDTTLADDEFARQTWNRVQRIIAERFLPLLDDVFVAHKTHILRTTAYAGGPACIASVLGQKSKEMGASVLVVGNGTSSLLHSILFPSVSKAVAKLKKVPVVVVGPSSVQHYGAGEHAGKSEAWDGGAVLQMRGRGQASLKLARSSCVGVHPPAAGNDTLRRISAALLRSSASAAPNMTPQSGDVAGSRLGSPQPSAQLA